MRNRMPAWGCVVCAIVLSLLGGAAHAQLDTVQTIESNGMAEIDAIPTVVEYELYGSFSAPTSQEAIEKAFGFDGRLQEALKSGGLQPAEATVTGPVLVSRTSAAPGASAGASATAAAKLRFNLAAYRPDHDGFAAFAALCDQVEKMAAGLECTYTGPDVKVADPLPAQQQAVQEAVKNAYATAEAAAAIMRGSVVAVKSVSIKEVVWNPDAKRGPALGRATCRASVQVTYIFGSGT